ncbi:MAG: hypothetical protein QME28_05560 [Candidatus Saccharicenans sp.]|nr:hypothetical protein [Candidatus Saccharicenans sp.]
MNEAVKQMLEEYEIHSLSDALRALRQLELFVINPSSLEVWSKEFFLDVASQIKIV